MHRLLNGHRPMALLLILAGALALPARNAAAAGWHSTPVAGSLRGARPVLAFYYSWYHRDTWCGCHMSDLPITRYDSSDTPTIDRQIRQAAQAGITGFITSWPGPNNTQDSNLSEILARAAVYQRQTHVHFVTSVYVESDEAAVRTNLVGAMRYLVAHYTGDPHFFHWQGRPVIFVWHPIGNGRTLATWANVRRQVDPGHRLIWSAEGTDIGLLSVFDGLHLFSAAYWGLLDGSIRSVDQGFRSRIDAYNSSHRVQKIWAAGVEPGYDDTRVPGRVGAYRVPRKIGATYRTSWLAGMASRPEWITITSFNEWFEGSMIEPSATYRSLYLTLTSRLAWLWRHTPRTR